MNPFIGMSYGTAIAHVAMQFAQREALVFENARYSFAEAKREIDRASTRLAQLGLRRREKVALWMANRPEFIWYWLGAAQIGLVPVVLNNRLSSEEAVYQIDQSDSRAIIVPGERSFRDFLGDLMAVRPDLRDGTADAGAVSRLPKLEHVLVLDPVEGRPVGVTDWSQRAADDLPLPAIETDPNAPGLIAYSSGTTALPKGVVLNHTGFRKAWDHGERFAQTPDDRFLLIVPLFGILGNVNGVMTAWSRGSAVILERRFDARRAIELIERERCTIAYVFPLMVDQILRHREFRPERTATLRSGIIATTDTNAMRLAADELGMTNFFNSYGMTETSSACARTYSTDALSVRLSTHGKPLPDIEICIRGIDTGLDLPANEEGEICVRGYNIMMEYYNKPEETAAAFTSDGFFRTGDLGYMTPEGRLVFLRRIKDGYKHKGFNVSTIEVEKAISEFPGVSQVAVVGLPDRLAGEVGSAFVIAKAGVQIDAIALRSFLQPRLASFKLPAHIFQVDEFPLTAGTSKVRKGRLREMALERLQSKSGG